MHFFLYVLNYPSMHMRLKTHIFKHPDLTRPSRNDVLTGHKLDRFLNKQLFALNEMKQD